MSNSTLLGFYTAGSRSGNFGDPRPGGRRHRGQDHSHSRTAGTIAVPALLAGTVFAKSAPSSSHGFGYGITIRSLFEGEWYRVSYSHGPWASQNVGSVSQGQTILHEGTSGATSGSCVHVEVYREKTGTFIDPWPFTQRVLRAISGAPASTVGWSQHTVNRQVFLNAYRGEKLVVDGREGPASRDAYRRYQAFLKIGVDGVWGGIMERAHAAYVATFNKPNPSASAIGATTRLKGTAWVREIQKKYRRLGHNLGPSGVDGIDGPRFVEITKWEQSKAPQNGFRKIDVDGVAGNDTNAYLDWILPRLGK